jgi:hypothetical protein
MEEPFSFLMIKVLLASGDYRKSSDYVFSCLLNNSPKDFFITAKRDESNIQKWRGVVVLLENGDQKQTST